MSATFTQCITYLRRAAWHLRTGGVAQLRLFIYRQRTQTGMKDARASSARCSAQKTALIFADAPTSTDSPGMFADLRVAAILDDFSTLAWGAEFTLVPVTPTGWRAEVAEGVDLLLVESAWAGNRGTWKYKLTGSTAPAPELIALVEYCRSQGVPTVFWNKEDPPHFEDFLATAALFDHVFTSDSKKVDDYRDRLNHTRIGVLPFAAQPAIHNPIRPQHGYHKRDVAFAGMYFAHKYPERRQQMHLLLGAALQAFTPQHTGTGLEIFSRFLGDNPNYQFPEPYSQHVVGSLPYSQMLTAYKAYKVFLNVNSVTNSPSMCARRIFEITASGTPVVSTPSAAIPRYFSQSEVPTVADEKTARATIAALVLSPELNNRTVHRAQRKIWAEHTYSHRAAEVLDATGLPLPGGRRASERLCLPTVSVLASTKRPHQLDHLLHTVAAFTGVQLQLNLLTHGFDLPGDFLARARELGVEVSAQAEPATSSLGHCLNRLVDSAEGQVLTKIDDDDLYGSHYLLDLLYALRFSGADVVGKQGHYMHLAHSGATILRSPEREHRWTDFVMGPTLTASRELFCAHPFESVSRGEDTAFLRSVTAGGGRIYSADRFNFIQVRSGKPQSHAWEIDDAELLATAKVQFFGLGEEHIMF